MRCGYCNKEAGGLVLLIDNTVFCNQDHFDRKDDELPEYVLVTNDPFTTDPNLGTQMCLCGMSRGRTESYYYRFNGAWGVNWYIDNEHKLRTNFVKRTNLDLDYLNDKYIIPITREEYVETGATGRNGEYDGHRD